MQNTQCPSLILLEVAGHHIYGSADMMLTSITSITAYLPSFLLFVVLPKELAVAQLIRPVIINLPTNMKIIIGAIKFF